MVRKIIISIGYGLLAGVILLNSAFADRKECKNGSDEYCINIQVSNSSQYENSNNDLCFVLQLNGSDRFASGSIPMQQLPTALFAIEKNRSSLGKPLSFKIVKAQVVPSGQCDIKQASLQPVDGCGIFEFAAIAGVSRSMTLIESANNSGYTCSIKN